MKDAKCLLSLFPDSADLISLMFSIETSLSLHVLGATFQRHYLPPHRSEALLCGNSPPSSALATSSSPSVPAHVSSRRGSA